MKQLLIAASAANPTIVDDTANAKMRRIDKEKKIIQILLLIMITMCSWLLYFGLTSYFSPNKKLDNLSLVQIGGVITASPEVHIGSKSSKWVHVHLNNYPKFTFEISGVGFEAIAKQDLNYIQAGDSVYLSISESEYQKKISGEQKMNFWDKADSPESIWTYELSDRDYDYLTLENYKEANKDDSQYGLLIVIMGMCGLLVSVWQLYKLRLK